MVSACVHFASSQPTEVQHCRFEHEFGVILHGMDLDYNKWDKLARTVEDEEKQRKEEDRKKSKDKYLQEQAEKQQKWTQEHPGQEPHEHHSSCCGCGFADPEAVKRAAERKKNEIPLPERNQKKVVAVEATREHGNILFKEGKFNEAFAVYERGIMIINGSYGLTEAEQDKMSQYELLLELNMAACCLKLEENLKALDHCKIVLNLDPKNTKALYRLGQANRAMGHLDEAKTQFHQVLELDAKNADARKQLQEIKAIEEEQSRKEKEFRQAIAKKLATA